MVWVVFTGILGLTGEPVIEVESKKDTYWCVLVVVMSDGHID